MDVLSGQKYPLHTGSSRCSEVGPHWFDLFNSNLAFVDRWIVLQVKPGLFIATVQGRHYFKGPLGPDKSLNTNGGPRNSRDYESELDMQGQSQGGMCAR